MPLQAAGVEMVRVCVCACPCAGLPLFSILPLPPFILLARRHCCPVRIRRPRVRAGRRPLAAILAVFHYLHRCAATAAVMVAAPAAVAVVLCVDVAPVPIRAWAPLLLPLPFFPLFPRLRDSPFGPAG